MTFCFLIAAQCVDPSSDLALLMQTLLTGPSYIWPVSDGTLINVKCQTGYKWLSGPPSQSIQCKNNGSWNFLPACTGLSFCSLVIHLFIHLIYLSLKLFPLLGAIFLI